MKGISKIIFGAILISILGFACKNTEKGKVNTAIKTEFKVVKKGNYELYKPKENIKAVLVLFGGFPEIAEDIQKEFKILDLAKNNAVSILYMNYNQTLWMERDEKQNLAKELQQIFLENKLPTNNIYIGGFSSGGNVSLLMSDFIVENNLNIAPKGVFIVDSPIDLVALYRSSEKNLERNFSEIAVQESTWIIETLEKKFGNPDTDISKFEAYAVYTSKTKNAKQLKHLRNTEIRLYTEPDTIWWKEKRMADYDQMNSYYIQKLSETLQAQNFKNVQYIPTINKGYRSNRDRHPHSWSIVDKKELIHWMLGE